MTELQKCLAQNIKRYRKAMNLTQEQLAERAKTSTTYIGTIEIGKKFPSPQMLERIAGALQVRSVQLFQADEFASAQSQIDRTTLRKNLLKNITSAVEQSLAEW